MLYTEKPRGITMVAFTEDLTPMAAMDAFNDAYKGTSFYVANKDALCFQGSGGGMTSVPRGACVFRVGGIVSDLKVASIEEFHKYHRPLRDDEKRDDQR